MRRLTEDEMSALLASDGVAHLATVDDAGYPHVTPIWFLWSDPVIHLTSWVGRPHLQRIETNPRVGLVIDVEEEQRGDGQRPNRQIRITGDATVTADPQGRWTRLIRRKYVDAAITPAAAGDEAIEGRALITIVPATIRAVASV